MYEKTHLLRHSPEETRPVFGDRLPPQVLGAQKLIQRHLKVVVGLRFGAFTPHSLVSSWHTREPGSLMKYNSRENNLLNLEGKRTPLLAIASLPVPYKTEGNAAPYEVVHSAFLRNGLPRTRFRREIPWGTARDRHYDVYHTRMRISMGGT